MKITGSLRLFDHHTDQDRDAEDHQTDGQQAGDHRGVVRVEEVIATDIDDLWQACTDPDRLSRWIAEVSGDLRQGGEFQARFTSGWQGTGRIESCEPPRRLLVATREADQSAEQVIELWLTPTGTGTMLVIEERGLKADDLPAYGAGWQLHVEDLVADLAGQQGGELGPRWKELIGIYQRVTVG